EWQDAWRVTRALVRRLRRDVARDGSRFAVVVLPGAAEAAERQFARRLYFVGPGRAHERFDTAKLRPTVARFRAHQPIPCASRLAPFRPDLRTTGIDGYFQMDPHWTAAGHTLAAGAIVRGLRELHLVPSMPVTAELR